MNKSTFKNIVIVLLIICLLVFVYLFFNEYSKKQNVTQKEVEKIVEVPVEVPVEKTVEKIIEKEVMPKILKLQFRVDGYSINESSRSTIDFSDEMYSEYKRVKIASVVGNDYSKYCIVQAWNFITNSADTLEIGKTYDLKNANNTYRSTYVSTMTNTQGQYSRCIVNIELSK